jgi:hypothetical protein
MLQIGDHFFLNLKSLHLRPAMPAAPEAKSKVSYWGIKSTLA